MTHLLIKHRVEDFDRWKKAFDDFIETRRASGEKTWQIFRAEDDSNMIYAMFEWDTMENAYAFANKQELREAMQAAGVQGPPEMSFLNEAESGTV